MFYKQPPDQLVQSAWLIDAKKKIATRDLLLLIELLPDSDAIRRRVAERFRTRSPEPFDLLSAIGRDCVGAVQLLGEDETPRDVEGQGRKGEKRGMNSCLPRVRMATRNGVPGCGAASMLVIRPAGDAAGFRGRAASRSPKLKRRQTAPATERGQWRP